MYGAQWCGDCLRTKRLLERLNVEYTYLDVEHDSEAEANAILISGKKSIPVVVFPDGTHFVEPSDPDMKAKLSELNLL